MREVKLYQETEEQLKIESLTKPACQQALQICITHCNLHFSSSNDAPHRMHHLPSPLPTRPPCSTPCLSGMSHVTPDSQNVYTVLDRSFPSLKLWLVVELELWLVVNMLRWLRHGWCWSTTLPSTCADHPYNYPSNQWHSCTHAGIKG